MINTIVLKSTCTVTLLDRYMKAELGKSKSVDQVSAIYARICLYDLAILQRTNLAVNLRLN